MRLTRPPATLQRVQTHAPLRVGEEDCLPFRGDFCRDPHLLAQLAEETRFWRLARLDLATGELPQARQVHPRGPASDQQPAFSPDQADGDLDHGWAHLASLSC